MVGGDAASLPWLAEPLRRAVATRRGHALLIHGPQGVGQFELAQGLAMAWLCEAQDTEPPCGECAACRLVRAHSHPDLLVLVPEALRESLGWDAAGGEGAEAGSGEKSKAKPSKEIKVDAVRSAVAFAQTTSARGRAKVVVLHPAERMNAISANTLLKTLEEPPGDARFILGCAAPDALLPTIRSRCQTLALPVPPAAQAGAWLARHGVADPETMLAAAGGQPLEALEWSEQGVDAALWRRLPALVAQGDVSAFTGWPLPRLVGALQKLCHDAACVTAGAAPRYFPAEALGPDADAALLAEWYRALQRISRHVEHAWNAGLTTESLVLQGRSALAGRSRAIGAAAGRAPKQGASLD